MKEGNRQADAKLMLACRWYGLIIISLLGVLAMELVVVALECPSAGWGCGRSTSLTPVEIRDGKKLSLS